jgi:hypothetical protein
MKCVPRTVELLCALLLFAHAVVAQATTWMVTTSGEPAALDTNDCSGSSCGTLRGAINAAAPGDTIIFDAKLDGATISLALYTNCLSWNDTLSPTCLPRYAEWHSIGVTSVTQFGPSAFYISRSNALTIDATANGLIHGVTIARNASMGTANFRLFDVGLGASLTLKGLRLSGGAAVGGAGAAGGGGALGAGGAIFSQGNLQLTRCTLDGNTAQGGSSGAVRGFGGGGGGVGSSGDYSGLGGGPNGGSPGTFGSTGFGGGGVGPAGFGDFGGGGGGAQASSDGPAGGGGGFGGGGGGSGAGGGVGGFGGGSGGVSDGGSGGGMGGALFNDAGSMTLSNVTLTNNKALGGADNGGEGFGGAVFNYAGTLTLDQVTMTANSVANGAADGSGIYSVGDGNCTHEEEAMCEIGGAATLALSRSIVSGNTGGNNDIVVDLINNSSGSSARGDGNVIGAATPKGTAANDLTNSVIGAVNLGAFNSGGSGLDAIIIPGAGSAAIDAVVCGSTTIDQRGVARPQGARCDIGAVEVAFAVVQPAVPAPGLNRCALFLLGGLMIASLLRSHRSR